MRLIEALRVLQKVSSDEGETFKVYLVTGFNPLHLKTFLAAELCRVGTGRPVEIQTGLYGDFPGNLERLARSPVEKGVALLEWADLDPRLGIRGLSNWSPSVFDDILANVRARIVHIQSTIEDITGRIPLVVCLPTLPFPPISFTPGWEASSFELELRSCVCSWGRSLAQNQQVKILNSQRIDLCCPLGDRFDVRSELLAGFPYKLPYASSLAELLSRLTVVPLPKKGLITDLDGTLWQGILGEVSVDGVSWDLDHRSHMHGVYQQMLHALSAAGVLIGAASKNDRGLVEQVFEKRDPILPREAVCPIDANWGPKSDSVDHILKVWNIAADSVVFVDDSPLELAEVKAAHPGIECIQFPANDEDAVNQLLLRLRDLFGKNAILAEDTLRLESIRRSLAEREIERQSGSAPEHFLEQAEAELYVSYGKLPLDPRPLELINKTNQFNLNGKRHTDVSWRDYLRSQDTFVMTVSYKDKYGPLGKIAVLAGRRDAGKVFVDTWVMSCRAFSRRIEHRCLEELFQKYEAVEVEFDFIATDRNGPLQEFLAEMLGQPPVPGCCLSRAQFVARRRRTFHRVLENANA